MSGCRVGAGSSDTGEGGLAWPSSLGRTYTTSTFSASVGLSSLIVSGRRSVLFPDTTGITTSGGGVDFFAAAAMAPSPARQMNPSATVLITWSPPEMERATSVMIESVQNEAVDSLG